MMQPHDLFSDFDPPTPPDGLRARTLAAAAAAMDSAPEPAEPDVWTRIWRSPVARLAWAACITLLLAGHIVIGQDTRSPDGITIARADAELAEIATLTPLRFDVQPLGAVFAAIAAENTTPMEDSSS